MAHGRRKRGGHDDHEEHVDEAWLVSYADMMTLLVALFMVLFSISSVNISKFESLQRSLQAAFSGKIFPGGAAMQQTGGQDTATKSGVSNQPPTFVPSQPKGKQGVKAEERQLQAIKQRIEQAAAGLGLSQKVKVRVTQDGLRVRVLTDDLLFASGQAQPRPEAMPLLARLGTLLAGAKGHPVIVEGHTDPVPTAGGPYATNWELSTARASTIVRAFATAGIARKRLTAAGRAYLDPITSNDTSAGRSLNRRVEILLPRMAQP
jgi:chemotaxis protein MotB